MLVVATTSNLERSVCGAGVVSLHDLLYGGLIQGVLGVATAGVHNVHSFFCTGTFFLHWHNLQAGFRSMIVCPAMVRQLSLRCWELAPAKGEAA
ncbi:hypothetical protein CCHOA_04515 [Corynebacterium choanae]|uniref:Uncharacterized protein n=1 Tax=Corynebacterium choanae TaxID=1862358 RepID=A0A3G6J5E3_9CORY|nr:hypothetical protein CCHOA_04515 [Corynebacterium choanae]